MQQQQTTTPYNNQPQIGHKEDAGSTTPTMKTKQN